jgi:hypothetical protein
VVAAEGAGDGRADEDGSDALAHRAGDEIAVVLGRGGALAAGRVARVRERSHRGRA